jgi:hypothetical protein
MTSYFLFFFSTLQKVPYLARGIGRYDPLLQIPRGRILKKLVLIEEKQKYYILIPNMFFSL